MIDGLWDYSDPAGSEARFRAALPAAGEDAGDRADRAEALSQLARSLLFQQRLPEARATLDEAEHLLADTLPSRARIRCTLERGRLLAGEGDPAGAGVCYLEALVMARALGADAHAVDAAHMLAINEGLERGQRWEHVALELAEASDEPAAQQWLGTLYLNMGVTHLGRGESGLALRRFQAAALHYRAQGDDEGARQASALMGHVLRRLGNPGDALSVTEPLLRAPELPSRGDLILRYERGLCLMAVGRPAEARRSFVEGRVLLGRNPSLATLEPALARWLTARA